MESIMAISLAANAPGGRTKVLEDGSVFNLDNWYQAVPKGMQYQMSAALTQAKYRNPNVFSAIALAIAVLKLNKQEQAKTRGYLSTLQKIVLEGDLKVGRAMGVGKTPKWAKGAEEEYIGARSVIAMQMATLLSVITGTPFDGCHPEIGAELPMWHKAFNDAWRDWAASEEGEKRLAATARSGGKEAEYAGGGDFYDPRTGAAVSTTAARSADSLRFAAAQAAARSAAVKEQAAKAAKVAKDFAAQLKAAEAAAGNDE